MSERQATGDRGRRRSGWILHLVGAVLGLAYAAAVRGASLAELELRSIMQRDFVAWPLWVVVGGFTVVGAATVVVVLTSRRMPWMPTAAALLLLYGIAESSFTRLAEVLPRLGPWQPALDWGVRTVSFTAGAMVAASVWGWWSYWRSANALEEA